MKSNEIFDLINEQGYVTAGDDIQYKMFINTNERTLYLCFAPSNSTRDWINNFDFPVKIYKKQESCMKVSQGWGNAWKSCNDVVMDYLIQGTEKNPNYKIIITGWSFGGAMATLACEDFYYRTKKKATLITFGSPKALFGKQTKDYVSSCIESCVEYTHVNDVVPLLPPFNTHINKHKLGGNFSFFELFNPEKWHCIYNEPSLYN